MNNIWKYLNENAGALGIIIPIVLAIASALWSFLSYMALKRKEVHEKRLHLYHDLVNRLVSPTQSGAGPFLQCQIAIVYELTNFPEYDPVTNRILQGLKDNWESNADNARLIKEISTAIQTIRNRK